MDISNKTVLVVGTGKSGVAAAKLYVYSLFFSLQMPCVMVPIGQNAHHVRGM